jgi:Tfp pilus tip-associated adhesin PilY1
VLPLTGTNVVAGERVIAPPVRYTVAGKVDAIIFTSIVPGTDPCNASIDTWITAIDALSGGASKAFDGLTANSLKIGGGSPRGVFVLQDGGDPTLYISQTIFNGSAPTTTFGTISGGDQTVNIGGVSGETRILGIKLTKPTPTSSVVRQVWRQLK